MSVSRISVDLPSEVKEEFQLITTRKKSKLVVEIRKMIDSYIKKNRKKTSSKKDA